MFQFREPLLKLQGVLSEATPKQGADIVPVADGSSASSLSVGAATRSCRTAAERSGLDSVVFYRT